MAGQDDATFCSERTICLARIHAKTREGVWALRDNSALQAHWEGVGAGSTGRWGASEAGEIGAEVRGLLCEETSCSP